MINLGIVIAVCEYVGGASNLPACSQDGLAMAKVLEIEPRFDDVILIDGDTRSSTVKSRLIEFINRYKGKEIGDIVFYFTGHGDFSGDEFYYLLSDYDPKRRKQTSIENSELDDLIRNLNPSLFVKIVDACHSGVAYIKSADDFHDYLKSAKAQFRKLYFMFSSQSEQFSYQDAHLSYFTKRLIEAIAAHEAPSLRYKDLIDFISDAFQDDTAQTPFFVTQADFTELFCDISTTLKNGISEFLIAPGQSQIVLDSETKTRSIAELVRKDAELYCTESETLQRLALLPEMFRKIPLPDELKPLYDLSVHDEKSAVPPESPSIGRWLQQNKDDKRYFVSVTTERRPVQRDLGKYGMVFNILGGTDGKSITEYREYVTGYKLTVSLPYSYLTLFTEPKYPNIQAGGCFIVPLISMTHLRLFWAFTLYDYVGWKDRQRSGKLEWMTDEVVLKDNSALEGLVRSIASKFITFLETPIKAKWGPQEDTKQHPDAAPENQAPKNVIALADQKSGPTT